MSISHLGDRKGTVALAADPWSQVEYPRRLVGTLLRDRQDLQLSQSSGVVKRDAGRGFIHFSHVPRSFDQEC